MAAGAAASAFGRYVSPDVLLWEQQTRIDNLAADVATLSALIHELLPEAREMVDERRAERQAAKDAMVAREMHRTLEAERQREAEARTYTCAICMDDTALADLYIVDVCNHHFCRGCVLQHAKMQVRDGNADIQCPGFQEDGTRCAASVDFQQITELLRLEDDVDTADVLARYDEISMERLMNADPDYARCPHILDIDGARVACNGWAHRQNAGETTGRCMACAHQFCIECRLTPHDGSCQDFAEFMALHGNDPEAAAYHQYRQRVRAQRCPGCGEDVERTQGCNHMTCRCRTHFCYICGQRAYGPTDGAHRCSGSGRRLQAGPRTPLAARTIPTPQTTPAPPAPEHNGNGNDNYGSSDEDDDEDD